MQSLRISLTSTSFATIRTVLTINGRECKLRRERNGCYEAISQLERDEDDLLNNTLQLLDCRICEILQERTNSTGDEKLSGIWVRYVLKIAFRYAVATSSNGNHGSC
ncbi:uncharacterized protein LOC130690286 [Daphnia carinata]|uniref:uncharacterized protein LOC130690286 n=1 Tax=Daphnia carinata TaxID=120202 RepID=UPI002868ADD8|nr:uncharacterized protein LOC130690286 [Daphnia carinata]